MDRCWWHAGHVDYMAYHDLEWGQPVGDDRRLFEKICLEGFQAGLSWLTILRKRESFRSAMAEFDFTHLAEFGESDIVRLLGNADIIRHRKKIESAINNARRALDLRDEFGSLATYFWQFEPAANERPDRMTKSVLVANPTTAHSTALSKDLKKRGWSFVGPTTIYAFMQAMGLVNDHVEGCFRRAELEAERRAFVRPT
nr:DNA-3-methyladenine glycosylase I [Pelagibius sp. Alg239-R121]